MDSPSLALLPSAQRYLADIKRTEVELRQPSAPPFTFSLIMFTARRALNAAPSCQPTTWLIVSPAK